MSVNSHYHVMNIVPQAPQSLQGGTSETDPQGDFIKLMISELQNQDPDNPMDGTAMVTQIEQMNSAVAVQRMSYLSNADSQVTTAASLLGHNVTIKDPTTGLAVSGKVDSVDYSGTDPAVSVNGTSYPLTAVSQVQS